MNHTSTILEISNKTNVGVEECNAIVEGFEKFAEGNIFHSSRKNYDNVAKSIAEETSINEETCKLVLETMNEVLGQSLKDKLTFKRKK